MSSEDLLSMIFVRGCIPIFFSLLFIFPKLSNSKETSEPRATKIQLTKTTVTYNKQLKVIQANIKKLKNTILERKSIREVLDEDSMMDDFPQSDLKNEKTNEVM